MNGYGHSSSGQPFTRRLFPDYLRQVSWLRGKLPRLPIYLWWLNWQTGKTISSYSCATAPDSHRLPYSFCSLQNTVNCVKNTTNVQPFFYIARGEGEYLSDLSTLELERLEYLSTLVAKYTWNYCIIELLDYCINKNARRSEEQAGKFRLVRVSQF